MTTIHQQDLCTMAEGHARQIEVLFDVISTLSASGGPGAADDVVTLAGIGVQLCRDHEETIKGEILQA